MRQHVFLGLFFRTRMWIGSCESECAYVVYAFPSESLVQRGAAPESPLPDRTEKSRSASRFCAVEK